MEDTNLIPENWNVSKSIIKVIGVGGGGCNAVSEMFKQGIKNVDFMVCNTDMQSLKKSNVPEQIRLGGNVSKGLGAGCDPERGRKAAAEAADDIRKSLEGNTEMVFITAGMGGGTGTGAAPVIAKIAKELKLLTIGVVTLPFRDEGVGFINRASLGIRELRKYVDSLLIIDNQKLYQVFSDLSIIDAFPRADEVLYTAVKSIVGIIDTEGFINVDFADVSMIMSDSGMAIMGNGEAEGKDRALDAVKAAFESPLLNDCDLSTAKSALVNITSSSDKEYALTMAELSQIMEYVNSYTGSPVKFKRGVVLDPNMGEKISVTVVATGFNMNSLPLIDINPDKSDRVVLGSETDFYTYPTNNEEPEEKNRVIINSLIEEPINGDSENSTNTEEGSTEGDSTPKITKPKYIKPEGKPALILESGDDISSLEQIPSIVRRKKLYKQN